MTYLPDSRHDDNGIACLKTGWFSCCLYPKTTEYLCLLASLQFHGQTYLRWYSASQLCFSLTLVLILCTRIRGWDHVYYSSLRVLKGIFGINVSTRTHLRMRTPQMTTREKNAQTRSRTLRSELSMTRGTEGPFSMILIERSGRSPFHESQAGSGTAEQPWCMSTWVLESKASTICVLQQWKSSI